MGTQRPEHNTIDWQALTCADTYKMLIALSSIPLSIDMSVIKGYSAETPVVRARYDERIRKTSNTSYFPMF